jgi:hypothetical protein
MKNEFTCTCGKRWSFVEAASTPPKHTIENIRVGQKFRWEDTDYIKVELAHNVQSSRKLVGLFGMELDTGKVVCITEDRNMQVEPLT